MGDKPNFGAGRGAYSFTSTLLPTFRASSGADCANTSVSESGRPRRLACCWDRGLWCSVPDEHCPPMGVNCPSRDCGRCGNKRLVAAPVGSRPAVRAACMWCTLGSSMSNPSCLPNKAPSACGGAKKLFVTGAALFPDVPLLVACAKLVIFPLEFGRGCGLSLERIPKKPLSSRGAEDRSIPEG